MHDTVQIEVQVVDRNDVFFFVDLLEDHGVASCEPPKEFRDSHFDSFFLTLCL